MGMEFAFYRVKRWVDNPKWKDISLEEFLNIERFIEWKNNPWNFEEGHYPTYKKYWDSFNHNDKFPGEPPKDIVSFYEAHRADSYDVAECVNYWGSGGKFLDDYLRDLLHIGANDYYKTITDRSFIDEALLHTEKELDKNRLIPMTMPEDIGEVELESDFGEVVKLNMNGYKIWIESKYYDPDERYLLKVFRDTLYSLKETNLDDYLVWYSRSW